MQLHALASSWLDKLLARNRLRFIQVAVSANARKPNTMIRCEKFTNEDFARFINWIVNESFMYQFAGPIFSFPITESQLTDYISDNNRKVY